MTSKFARTRVQLLSCILVAAQVHSDIHDGDPFVGVSLHERAQAADGVWPQPIVKIQLPQVLKGRGQEMDKSVIMVWCCQNVGVRSSRSNILLIFQIAFR